jgi:hypothetical protein
MKTLLTLLIAAFCAATGYGQTIKTLGYNTTNGQVVYSGTNILTFTTSVNFASDAFGSSFETGSGSNFARLTPDGFQFGHAGIAAATRTNLGLGATNNVIFQNITANNNVVISNSLTTWGYSEFNDGILINFGIDFGSTNIAAATRTNLGLGATNDVEFESAIFGYDFRIASGGFQHFGSGFELDAEGNSITAGAGILYIAGAIEISGTNSSAFAATTRTNFGLPLAALTNDSNVKLMRALSGSTNTNHPFSGSVSVVGTNTNTLVFSNGILQEVQ